jgi:hypothetical protein
LRLRMTYAIYEHSYKNFFTVESAGGYLRAEGERTVSSGDANCFEARNRTNIGERPVRKTVVTGN